MNTLERCGHGVALIDCPTRLHPPHDSRFTPVWNLGLLLAMRAGDQITDETVYPRFRNLLSMMTDESGNFDASRRPYPLPEGLPYTYPEMPGLVLRAATPDDIAPCASVLAARGNYTPDGAVLAMKDAIENALCWPLVLEFRGTRLQFETIFFETASQVQYGLTIHVDRGMPHWFWKECEAPVFRWLSERGVTSFVSSLREDRAYWLPKLVELYGHQVVGETVFPSGKRVINLRMDPAKAMSTSGWPERRTAGPGWTWSHGNLVCREMRDDELEEIVAFVASQPKPGQRELAELLERRWHLNRAAVLLGLVDGELRHVRLARERTPDEASTLHATQYVRTPDLRAFVFGDACWLQALGYKTRTTFVPQPVHEKVGMQRHLRENTAQKLVMVHREYPGEVFFEYQTDIDEMLSQTIDEWMSASATEEPK